MKKVTNYWWWRQVSPAQNPVSEILLSFNLSANCEQKTCTDSIANDARPVLAGSVEQTSNLLRSVSGLAVEDPLINLLSPFWYRVEIFNSCPHFNWRLGQRATLLIICSRWLTCTNCQSFSADVQNEMVKSLAIFEWWLKKEIFHSHDLKIFSNMKRQKSWLRVECNVEIISQLEVLPKEGVWRPCWCGLAWLADYWHQHDNILTRCCFFSHWCHCVWVVTGRWCLAACCLLTECVGPPWTSSDRHQQLPACHQYLHCHRRLSIA